MTNAEYLAVLEEGDLIRSAVVRLLEEQIRILLRLSEAFDSSGEIKLSAYCSSIAEETKWEAICIAEYEKEHGKISFTGGD